MYGHPNNKGCGETTFTTDDGETVTVPDDKYYCECNGTGWITTTSWWSGKETHERCSCNPEQSHSDGWPFDEW